MKPAFRFVLKSFAFSVVFGITVLIFAFAVTQMENAKKAQTTAEQAAARQQAREESERRAEKEKAAFEKDAELREESWKRSFAQYDRQDEYLRQWDAIVKRQAAVLAQQEVNAKKQATILAEQERRLGMSNGK